MIGFYPKGKRAKLNCQLSCQKFSINTALQVKISVIVLMIALSPVAFGQTQELCFTFDDLPVVALRDKQYSYRKAVTEKLTATLKQYQIPAIGFVNARKLSIAGSMDSMEISLLRFWFDSGLELGNHSYSHYDYNRVSFRDYSEDILRGEPVLKDLAAEYGRTLRYFRHPFLHRGDSKEKADSLEQFLKIHGYREAPVTIDNAEYIFNAAYDSARAANDTLLMQKIGVEYITYMEQKLLWFEGQSQKLFGYNMRQILLLHANALNAEYLGDLIKMIQRHDYRFVNIDRALEDQAYQTPDRMYKPYGISWLDRWALTAGHKGDFFRGEPRTPDYILKLSGFEHE